MNPENIGRSYERFIQVVSEQADGYKSAAGALQHDRGFWARYNVGIGKVYKATKLGFDLQPYWLNYLNVYDDNDNVTEVVNETVNAVLKFLKES